MDQTRLTVTALRVLLGTAFALLVVLQTFSLPGQFASMARETPEMAYLRWPLTAFAVVELVCVQVVIVSTWKLLSRFRAGQVFSEASLGWVDAIVWAVGTAWVLLVGGFLWVGFHADDPGLPLLLFVVVVGGAAVGLLLLVMRALLRQATTLRSDLETVI